MAVNLDRKFCFQSTMNNSLICIPKTANQALLVIWLEETWNNNDKFKLMWCEILTSILPVSLMFLVWHCLSDIKPLMKIKKLKNAQHPTWATFVKWHTRVLAVHVFPHLDGRLNVLQTYSGKKTTSTAILLNLVLKCLYISFKPCEI